MIRVADTLQAGVDTTLPKQFESFFNSQEDSDMTLLIGPEERPIYAHSSILSKRSHYFLRALSTDLGKIAATSPASKIDTPPIVMKFPEDDYIIFMLLMEYLYCGKVR